LILCQGTSQNPLKPKLAWPRSNSPRNAGKVRRHAERCYQWKATSCGLGMRIA
jgi:hypothetical protein